MLLRNFDLSHDDLIQCEYHKNNFKGGCDVRHLHIFRKQNENYFYINIYIGHIDTFSDGGEILELGVEIKKQYSVEG